MAEQPPWFRVDRRVVAQLPALSVSAIKVYIALGSMADFKTGECFPKLATLAVVVGMTERATQKGLAQLQCAGLVKRREQRGRSGASLANVFVLPPPPDNRVNVDSPSQLEDEPEFTLGRTCVHREGEPGFTPGVNVHSPLENKSQCNENQQNESQSKKGRKAAVDVVIPTELDSADFRAAWADWLAYRKERRLTCTERTLRAQLAKLAGWGPSDAVASIRESIANGWAGIFKPKDQMNGHTQRTLPVGPGQRYDPNATLGAF